MYIETARLILRPFELKDAANLLAYLSKPTVNCFQNDQLNSTDEAVAVIQERRLFSGMFSIDQSSDW